MTANFKEPRSYRYVGPAHLERHATSDSARVRVESAGQVASWMAGEGEVGRDGMLTVTFVVLADGVWIADRHSEHIACARRAAVLSAGEMTFALDRRRAVAEVVAVTNQSTGYCPEAESWPAVGAALDAAGIVHPGGFTTAMIFRRCVKCGSTNIVKDGWFECGVCGAELPRAWNFGDGSKRQGGEELQ